MASILKLLADYRKNKGYSAPSPTPAPAKPLSFVSNTSGSLGINKPEPIVQPTTQTTKAVVQKPQAMVFNTNKVQTKPQPIVAKPDLSAVMKQQLAIQRALEAEVKPTRQQQIGQLGHDILGQTIGSLPRVALQSTIMPAQEALGLKSDKAAFVPKSAVSKFLLGSEPIYSLPAIAKQGADQIKKGQYGAGAATIGLGMLGTVLDATPGGGGKKKAVTEATEAAGGLLKGGKNKLMETLNKAKPAIEDEAALIKRKLEDLASSKSSKELADKASIQSELNKIAPEKTRSLPESIKGSDQYPQEVKDRIGGVYTPQSNAETTKAAQEAIASSRDSVIQKISSAEDLDAVGFEQARLLTREAIEQGRIDDAISLIETASQKATKAGQSVQALRLWGEMTPEGALKYTQREIDKFNDIDAIARGGIGKKSLTKKAASDIAEAAADIQKYADDSPEKAAAVAKLLGRVQEAVPATMSDKIAEWGRAIKLTSIRSIERNWLGNTVEMVYSPVKRLTAGLIDSVEVGGKKLLGKDAKREVYASDMIADISGRISGAKDGFKNFLKAIVDEDTVGAGAGAVIDGAGKKAIKGKLGYVIRTPFRLMNDEMFTEMAKRSELSVEANRAARKAGLNGADHKAFIDNFIKNPPESIMARVNKNTADATYKADLGPMGQKFQAAIREVKIGPVPVGEIIVPFFKTPINILKKFASEKSALGLIAKSNRDALKQGGAAAQEAKAKMLLGFGTSLGMGAYVMNGDVTGAGPKNKNEREMLEATGWRPYSIKVGDKYVSYANLGEITLAIGTVADAFEAISDYKEVSGETATDLLARASLAFGNNIYSQSFLTGIQDALSAIDDPAGAGGRFLSNTGAGMIIPAIQSDITRAQDPVVRQPKGFIETLKSRTPGLSQSVTPKRDVYGKEVIREGGPLAALLSPVTFSTDTSDNTSSMLAELNKSIGRPSTTMLGRKMSNNDADLLQKETGRLTKSVLDELSASEEFRALPEEAKIKTIEEVITKVRSNVKKNISARVELGALGLDANAPAEKKALIMEVVNNKKYKDLPDDQKRRVLLEILNKK